jgi:homocysteine S-methyltransferase
MSTANMNATDFAILLATGKPVLIDGGFATQCEAMGCNIDGDLWSARLLREDPGAIVRAHRAFLDAGARIIATASYQASREGFAAVGMSASEADALMLASVALAIQARDEFLRDNPGAPRPLVAASMGPYGAILHDGSEYTGAYRVSRESLREFHQQRLAVFAHSAADLLALETIPNGAEAAVLGELLSESPKPAWMSFSCRDDKHLADGTTLADVVHPLGNHPTLLALGVNCVAPDLVVPLIGELRSIAPDKPIVVYPNSGEVYQPADNSWHGTATPVQCERAVMAWLEAGATLVGGCCRIGPQQIAAMAASIAGRTVLE